MDEIDSIGSARMESGSGNGDSEVQRTMLELLNQLDGFEASNKIKVFFYPPPFTLFPLWRHLGLNSCTEFKVLDDILCMTGIYRY